LNLFEFSIQKGSKNYVLLKKRVNVYIQKNFFGQVGKITKSQFQYIFGEMRRGAAAYLQDSARQDFF